MSDDENNKPETINEDIPEPPEANESDPLQLLKDQVTEAFQAGANQAKEAIENQISRVEGYTNQTNSASYAIGYALSFGSTLLREYSPEVVTEGFDQGSAAGEEAAANLANQKKDSNDSSDE